MPTFCILLKPTEMNHKFYWGGIQSWWKFKKKNCCQNYTHLGQLPTLDIRTS